MIGTAGGRHGIGYALARDDDGAGGRDSRIDFTLPRDGEYVIRVNPLVASTGRYTLEVESDRYPGGYNDRRTPSAPAPPPGSRAERRPDRGRGRRWRDGSPTYDPTLDNGTAYHLYPTSARRGERLVINLRSNDFDPYLVIGTPGGRHGVGTALARDDDGASGRDSRIDFAVPSDGEYVIRVNPLAESTGRYVLALQSDRVGGGAGPRRLRARRGGRGPGGPLGAGAPHRAGGPRELGQRIRQRGDGVPAHRRGWQLHVGENGRTRRGQLQPIRPRATRRWGCGTT